MKSLLIIFTLLNMCVSYADPNTVGGGGGGLNMQLAKSINGPGGTGGGPIDLNDSQLINEIDNIEIYNEVKFPETFNEKIELLKKDEVQSIQLINGQIISY